MTENQVNVVYADPRYFVSFHAALSEVANEMVFLEMTQAPALELVTKYQTDLINKGGPSFYAVSEDRVVGWCDVFPKENPRQAHRGTLGMGILKPFRGQGIGSRLVDAVLKKAKSFGLEKVELTVYTSNPGAIALYEKFGFEREGLIRSYRKVNGQTFDGILMGKFL